MIRYTELKSVNRQDLRRILPSPKPATRCNLDGVPAAQLRHPGTLADRSLT